MYQKIPVEQQGFCKKDGDIQPSVCVEARPSGNFSVFIYQMTVPRRPRAQGFPERGEERLVRHSHTAVTMLVSNLLSLGRGSGLGRAPETVVSSCPFQPSPELTGVWGHSTALLQHLPPPKKKTGHCFLVNGTNSSSQCFLFVGLNRNQILPQINL